MLRLASRAAAVAIALTLLVVGVVDAAAWPMLGRTPYRTSATADDPGVALAARWSRLTGGQLTAAPVVVGGHVFIGSDDGTFYAVGTANGKVAWTFSPLARIRASAAVDMGIVYMAGFDGNVYALETATGWLRWQLSTASWIVAAPLIYGGAVVAACYAGVVYAVDPYSGAQRWRYSVGDDFIDQAPTAAGDGLLIATVGGTLLRLDLVSGEPVWKLMIGDRPVASPVVAGDRAYLVTGGPDGRLLAVNVTTGKELWSLPADGEPWTGVAAGGRRLVAGRTGSLLWLDDVNGEVLVQQVLPGQAAGPPVMAANRILVPLDTDSGGALAVVSGATERPWTVALPAVPVTPLAVSGDGVFFGGSDQRVYAVGPLRIAVGPRELSFHGVWPHVRDGRVVVPVRQAAEALGATVRWDAGTGTATVVLGDRVVRLTTRGPGANAWLIDGRLVAPVRPLAEGLRANVDWEPLSLRVTLWVSPEGD